MKKVRIFQDCEKGLLVDLVLKLKLQVGVTKDDIWQACRLHVSPDIMWQISADVILVGGFFLQVKYAIKYMLGLGLVEEYQE